MCRPQEKTAMKQQSPALVAAFIWILTVYGLFQLPAKAHASVLSIFHTLHPDGVYIIFFANLCAAGCIAAILSQTVSRYVLRIDDLTWVGALADFTLVALYTSLTLWLAFIKYPGFSNNEFYQYLSLLFLAPTLFVFMRRRLSHNSGRTTPFRLLISATVSTAFFLTGILMAAVGYMAVIWCANCSLNGPG
jgi:hypothetical protein